MCEYTANGNMYGGTRVFSGFYSNMHTEPFKTSVNELYNYMLRRCLNKFKEYEDPSVSIEFAVLRHMQQQAINPLSVASENDAYYFTDAKGLRRIDKYESN